METILRHHEPGDAEEETSPAGPVRCPICADPNSEWHLCRHVRWTFEQGGPIEFASFALETSPYVRMSGHRASEITAAWLEAHGEWIVERVTTHFDASDGYVFGELAHVDLLARDIWREFHPEAGRPQMHRTYPG